MTTMYDRLGDLLNETLQAGEVKFIKVEAAENAESAEVTPEDSAEKKEQSDRSDFVKNTKDENVKKRKKTSYTKPKAKNVFIYKKITPEVERAYRLLDLNFQATFEDLKKAYKEKLKYYHPDRYEDNEVLKKVATDKTRQIVDAYKMICVFFEK